MDFNDDYAHPEGVDALYFPQSVPTKSAESLYKNNFLGCDCEGECTLDLNCVCCRRSGTYYVYDDVKNLENYEINVRNDVKSPTYECGSNCKCNYKICGNKLVQFGPRSGLTVEKCNDIKGLGVFLNKFAKKGNFICEYAGEVTTEEEAMSRFKLYREIGNRMNYIFCINESYGDTIRKTFIDPTKYGNIGRYVNHSCEPNCALFITRINSTMPSLAIFASKDIHEGDEITYDYCENDTAAAPKNDNNLKKNCFCGSDSCRKYLPFDETLV